MSIRTKKIKMFFRILPALFLLALYTESCQKAKPSPSPTNPPALPEVDLNVVTDCKIKDLADFETMRKDYKDKPDAVCVLLNDINFADVQNFEPISNFTGTFAGNNKKIINLKINKKTNDNTAFFAGLTPKEVRNLIFESVRVEGRNSVGVLIGNTKNPTPVNINNVRVLNAYVSGITQVGGLVGNSTEGLASIKNSFVKGKIIGQTSKVGGLIGRILGIPMTGGTLPLDIIDTKSVYSLIENSYAIVELQGTIEIGGLIGFMSAVEIINSYSSGTVLATGVASNGGLVGLSNGSVTRPSLIKSSYSAVTTLKNAAGLLGAVDNTDHIVITDSYFEFVSFISNPLYADLSLKKIDIKKEKFENWPVDVWNIPNEGWPTLKNMPN